MLTLVFRVRSDAVRTQLSWTSWVHNVFFSRKQNKIVYTPLYFAIPRLLQTCSQVSVSNRTSNFVMNKKQGLNTLIQAQPSFS